MEIDLAKMIQEMGLSVALVVYFLIKDWKFTQQIVALMTKLDDSIDAMRGAGR